MTAKVICLTVMSWSSAGYKLCDVTMNWLWCPLEKDIKSWTKANFYLRRPCQMWTLIKTIFWKSLKESHFPIQSNGVQLFLSSQFSIFGNVQKTFFFLEKNAFLIIRVINILLTLSIIWWSPAVLTGATLYVRFW